MIDFAKKVKEFEIWLVLLQWKAKKQKTISPYLINEVSESELKKAFLSKDIRKTSKLRNEYIETIFNQLYNYSNENSLYFEYSSFLVYELTFESRFKEAKDNFFDISKLDFVKNEYERLIFNEVMFIGLEPETQKRLIISYRKKRLFLENILKEHNLKTKVKTVTKYKPNFEAFVKYENIIIDNKKIEPEPLDLSDTSTVENKIIVIKEPYGEMFSNNGFELFEYILNEYVKPKEAKGRKSDLIYYYWEMHNSNTQYIHQRPEPFFKWFAKKYNETTGQLKTYNDVKTPQRIKDYSTALEWFKSKNK